MRVLVVDDDATFREALSDFLGEHGHQVATAASARKALDFLATDERDVIFTDLKMPRQTGLDLLKEVRRQWPRTFVVLVTGFATVSTAVEAMKLGAFEYIAKPFHGEQVLKVLHLIEEEQRFSDGALPPRDAGALAQSLHKQQGLPILLLTSPAAPVGDGVEVRLFDGSDPSLLKDEVDAFLAAHDRGGVVVAHAERMLENHRLEDILQLVGGLRERMRGHGPLAVGLDPARISTTHAEALRAVMVAEQVHGALEALSSPIRRRVLFRLHDGPAPFSDVMHAAELDDSPKMSFHLHRLVDEGLIVHADEQYRLTPKGEGAVGVLRSMERVAAGRTQETLVFQPPARATGRKAE